MTKEVEHNHSARDSISESFHDNGSAEDLTLLGNVTPAKRRGWQQRRAVFLAVFNFMLVTVVVLQSLTIFHLNREKATQLPRFSSNGLSNARDKILTGHGPTVFWNGDVNDTSADEAWESIEAGHGVVTVSPQYALDHGLPDSMTHPRDPSKRIYVIEAYHSIHCLQLLRRHHLNLVRGETPDGPMEHDLHCFDSLRQSIMCQANDELLWSAGHSDAGRNQARQCRDWDALRDWATSLNSCYHDYAPPAGDTRWGKCDNGIDGLPYGSLLG